MKIENHILKATGPGPEIQFDQSPNQSGAFADGLPDTIVIHYTAGSSVNSSATWLKNPQSGASAHVIVGKSGDILQLVPFNIIAWHAGVSQWKNRQGLNKYSIGIEIDNAGVLEKRGDGYYTHFGKHIDNSQVVLARHKNHADEQAWEAFTEKQLETVENLCLTLKNNYPIKNILGHDDIAPGRKTDPGPAFPLKSLRDKIIVGRKNDRDEDEKENLQTGVITADYLNIRTQPSGSASLASDPLPKGTKLHILERKEGWLKVNVDIQGWVSENWVYSSSTF